jgi:hypothetical protein
MTFLLSTDPWPPCVLAVAGMVMGLAGLLVRRRASHLPVWSVPALLVVVLALVGAGGFATGLPALVWQPALVLAGVWLVFGLARLGTLSVLRHPHLQAAALCLGSGLLLACQVYHIDREEEETLDATEARLRGVPRSPDFVFLEAGSALTDSGTPIPLFQISSDTTTQVSFFAEESCISRQRLHESLTQTGPASDAYNCHGWVFTSGRFWVRGSFVEQILEDNRYQAIATPAAGDLAVFRDENGEVTHTGVVHHIGKDGVVFLESKWGELGRYIHACTDHIYGDNTCTYYRSSRSGHLLRGLEDAPHEYAAVSENEEIVTDDSLNH